MSKILVTGATGELGAAVIDALLQKTEATNLVALARDVNKAQNLSARGIEVRKGDYSDFDSLIAAFKGIDKLYFVSGNDLTARVAQHENVAKAAKAAGVQHIVYTSFERKNETASSPLAAVAEGHLKAEAAIKATGITYTILKHNLYMDIVPMFLGQNVIDQGAIYLPAGEGKTAFALRKDMAEAGAAVLTSAGHENKYYNISSFEAHSFGEIAGILSEICGKTIRYISPAVDEFTTTLKGFGVPQPAIDITAAFAQGIAQNELDTISTDIEELTGKKPTTLRSFLEAVYGA